MAYEAADSPVLDLRFHVVMGAKVNIGEVSIQGLKRVHESLLRARLLLHTGDPYSASSIERARRDLLALGVFSQVSVSVGTAVDDSGGVPVAFKVRERLRHTFSVSSAFSSDLGGSGTVKWTDRNVFGGAQQFSISASVINLGGSDTTGIGYDTTATYLLPDFLRRDQALQFSVSALKQSLQAYDQTARTTGVTLSRKISSIWTVSVGGTTTDEQIIQDNTTRFYTLFALPISVAYDTTNLASPLEDPLHGIRGSVTVTPTARARPSGLEVSHHPRAGVHLLRLESPAAHRSGRTVLAARALAGIAQGAGELSLPPVSVSTPAAAAQSADTPISPWVRHSPGTTIPIGGTAISAAGLELRQRFGSHFGARGLHGRGTGERQPQRRARRFSASARAPASGTTRP